MTRLSFYTLIFGLWSSAVYAEIIPFAQQRGLDEVNRARQTLNYRGTVMILKNGQLETMKYQHQLENGIEVERLTSLESPLREIVRKAGELSCILSESKQKIVNHQNQNRSLLFDLPKSWAAEEKAYLIVDDGHQSIAGHSVSVFMILPKDDLRYGRKIWIDQQYALPLKLETFGTDGQTVAQVLFGDISVAPPTSDAKPAADEAALHITHIHDQQSQPFEQAPFNLKYWPPGFEIVYYIPNSLANAQNQVAHLLLSDGFSAVSVYYEDKQADSLTGANQLGTVNSFSRTLSGKQITVLGDVPLKTVQRIAESVVLR
jgi:sigma-E factor negative regulatory protein RseB